MDERYKAIINLPHHTSRKHRRMEQKARAAQFAPYAALTCFGAVVEETARITDERICQDEGEIEKMNRILTYILEQNGKREAAFTYFQKDKKKRGGQYVTRRGHAVKVDTVRRIIILSDKTFLPLDDITKIELI